MTQVELLVLSYVESTLLHMYVCMYPVKNSLGTMGAHPSLDSASEGFDRFAKCEATYDSSSIVHLIWGRWRVGG